jgi:hypothetical protein
MKVPLATISAHRRSYSSCEPSTQWIAAGLVSSAIFSTQRNRWSFLLSGTLGLRGFAGRDFAGAANVCGMDERLPFYKF